MARRGCNVSAETVGARGDPVWDRGPGLPGRPVKPRVGSAAILGTDGPWHWEAGGHDKTERAGTKDERRKGTCVWGHAWMGASVT